MLVFFFFNDTATTEIYTLSLHDALPILRDGEAKLGEKKVDIVPPDPEGELGSGWEKMAAKIGEHTSELQSPVPISYAVFCLKKKNKKI